MGSGAPVPDSVTAPPRLLRLMVSPLPLTVIPPVPRLNVALLAETVVPLPLKLTWLPAATLTVAPAPELTVFPMPVSEIEAPVPNVTVALLMVRASPVPVTVMVLDALLLFRVKALLLPFSVRFGWAGG